MLLTQATLFGHEMSFLLNHFFAVEMCVEGHLKPGVALLSGNSHKRKSLEEVLLNLMRERCGKKLIEARVCLRDDADQEKVYGRASQIRGGLFKLIDDCNNLNTEGGAGMCVIVCEVNGAGQYMLRELLDSGEVSKTHRHSIRKDGVMFIVSVDNGAEVQEMMLSRAHYAEIL